jgi:cyanophycinase
MKNLLRPFAAAAFAVALALAATAESPSHRGAEPGRLVIVGGALADSNAAIYRAILDARLGNGPFCIFPTAAATPDSAIDGPVKAFEKYVGPGTVKGILISSAKPESARDPAVVAQISACSGFFFVGGVQSRVVTAFRPDGKPTPAYDALMARWREGAVVSGSSAGAAIMSDPMIAGGTSAGAIVRGVRRTTVAASDSNESTSGVTITTGLGFFPSALADQHFLARARFGRLLVALLDLDQFDLAFGIDENTALVVEGGVVWNPGLSDVVIMDERPARREGKSATGVRVHLMGAGDRFDLATRTLTINPDKTPLPRTVSRESIDAPKDVFARWELLHLLDRFARVSQTELAIPVDGGQLVIHKDAGFRAVARNGAGVQGTPAGLAMTGLSFDLRRAP